MGTKTIKTPEVGNVKEVSQENQAKKAADLLKRIQFEFEALKQQRNSGFDEAALFHSQIKMLEIQVDELVKDVEKTSTRIEELEETIGGFYDSSNPEDSYNIDYEDTDDDG